MPFSRRALDRYRQDEKEGHTLLTPEDRIKLLKPYLPSPPPQSSRRSGRDAEPTFGVRQFLKKQLHLLVFAIIHAVFSLYIKIRHAYNAVHNRFYIVLYHHHRTPEFIQKDVHGLVRLPKHLSVILHLEDEGRRSGGLEKLLNEAADIAAWCASAGIPQLSIYEKTGIMKRYQNEAHRAVSKKLAAYFGANTPSLSMRSPHGFPIESAPTSLTSGNNGRTSAHLSMMLLSIEDGRDSIVDLTKSLAEVSQLSKISPADISIEGVDAELSESVMGEPDLLILFGPHVELFGYPPWQIRLTEIFHVQDNQGVDYQVFYRGLKKYAQAQMRLGK